MSLNEYDHEDAFKSANMCAGRLTNMVEALKFCKDKDVARVLIGQMQETYQNLFTAFIEGVDYGRRNPRAEQKEDQKF